MNKPKVTWAERLDSIYLTIQVVSLQDRKLDITSDKLYFYGKDGNGKEYEFEIIFREPIDVDQTKQLNARWTELIMKKQKPNLWRSILPKGQKNWVQCDWDRFIESDDEDGIAGQFDSSGMETLETRGGQEGDFDIDNFDIMKDGAESDDDLGSLDIPVKIPEDDLDKEAAVA